VVKSSSHPCRFSGRCYVDEFSILKNGRVSGVGIPASRWLPVTSLVKFMQFQRFLRKIGIMIGATASTFAYLTVTQLGWDTKILFRHFKEIFSHGEDLWNAPEYIYSHDVSYLS